MVTSDITARSFRVSWTHAPGQVERYRVVYYPASGGQPEEKVGVREGAPAVPFHLMRWGK